MLRTPTETSFLTSPAFFGLVIKAWRRATKFICDALASEGDRTEDEAIPVLNLCLRRDKPT